MLLLRGYQAKIVILLLFLPPVFSACVSPTSIPVVGKNIPPRNGHKGSPKGLELLLRHLRLTERDLSLTPRYSGTDPFRLEKVNSFLKYPLHIEPYAAHLANDFKTRTRSIEALTQLALRELEFDVRTHTIFDSAITTNSSPTTPLFAKLDKHARNALLSFYLSACSAQKKMNNAFKSLKQQEIAYLGTYFSEMILMDKIMNTPGRGASDRAHAQAPLKQKEQYVRERAFHVASTIDFMQLYEGSLMLAAAVDKLLNNSASIAHGKIPHQAVSTEGIRGDIIFIQDTPLGKIIIGGKGTSYYNSVPALLIVDLGGNDEYHNITASPSFDPFTTFSTTIIDLDGNDLYTGDEGYAEGSGVFGFSCLVDQGGNDTYLSGDYSQGSGLFGVGILYDRTGNDRYRSDVFGQGSGAFGCGILCDLGGDDSYYANLYSQGFGFVGGVGLLMDSAGNDSFVIGDTYPDYREPDVAFDSFSQGCGLGDRYFASGGIGILLDHKGNDTYRSNYFSQGSSYWFALGLLLDGQGNDTYQARRYTQGTGTHHTVAALIDRSGNDTYVSWGVSQGCGYDYSQGLLFDEGGNDIYRSDWFSQGTSGLSGIGLMVDQSGDDVYIGGSLNSQGSGQYDDKREEGSIGLLLDLKGADRYTGKGKNNFLWRQGRHGGGIDVGDGVWENSLAPGASTVFTFRRHLPPPVQKTPVFSNGAPLPELESDLSNADYRSQVILELSARGPAIIPQLLDYLAVKDTQLTSVVCKALGGMGPAAAPPLREMLERKTLDRSRTAALLSVLIDIKDDSDATTFLSFLGNDDPHIRTLAMRGLKALDYPDLTTILLSGTQDENRSVRKFCARTLKGSEDPAAIKALTGLLGDEHYSVRFAAFDGLEKEKDRALPCLMESISDKNGLPVYALDLMEDLLQKWEQNKK